MYKETVSRLMEIIPAIDLLGGNCVRLNQGNYNKITKFNSDPVSQALTWQEQGAKRLHLVDLDGAKTGKPINNDAILAITNALDIPIQIGGGIRTLERAKELFDYGIERVILGTIAIEDPKLVKMLIEQYPNKVILGIDAKEGKVATRGWIKQSDIKATDLVKNFASSKLAAIISTDIATDGTLKGPNLSALRQIAESTNLPVIASGGIGSIADLLSLTALEESGVTGVIVGRALYDKNFDLNEAIRSIAKPRIQDSLQKGINLA
tara:strand:- start:2681 stop:3475 length:795 start_codon:yes stop_codon:yes gene_type:complete